MSATFTIAEVAKQLGCSQDQVRAFIDANEIAAFNIGRGTKRKRWRIPEDAVEAFKRRRMREAKPQAARTRKPHQTVGNWI